VLTEAKGLDEEIPRRFPTLFPKARGIGEEVRRRLSGHGFSPQERRAKEEVEASFLAGEASGLTN
jgi:hypothetical protein